MGGTSVDLLQVGFFFGLDMYLPLNSIIFWVSLARLFKQRLYSRFTHPTRPPKRGAHCCHRTLQFRHHKDWWDLHPIRTRCYRIEPSSSMPLYFQPRYNDSFLTWVHFLVVLPNRYKAPSWDGGRLWETQCQTSDLWYCGTWSCGDVFRPNHLFFIIQCGGFLSDRWLNTPQPDSYSGNLTPSQRKVKMGYWLEVHSFLMLLCLVPWYDRQSLGYLGIIPVPFNRPPRHWWSSRRS